MSLIEPMLWDLTKFCYSCSRNFERSVAALESASEEPPEHKNKIKTCLGAHLVMGGFTLIELLLPVLRWNPQGKRKRGRQAPPAWRRSTEAEATRLGYSWGQLEVSARNWQRWRDSWTTYAPPGANGISSKSPTLCSHLHKLDRKLVQKLVILEVLPHASPIFLGLTWARPWPTGWLAQRDERLTSSWFWSRC